ncbi:hypothetical protein L1785_13855 [Antribacter sp. KLBMP9083]|uniref:Uncharacterized protein n=1 Tax=Antribacter soli TaxID=2910976 RepID=A0AA41QFA2_9MICO|nr:hypothetical protein [Antribacter soli]MCF4122063.1 hypothetical protein [Antribacter soli]
MRFTKQGSESSLARTFGVVVEAVSKIGLERIGSITLTPDRISLVPRHLTEGEEIAKALGCNSPLDHHILTPGFTDWTGQVSGLEVHVRATLRRPEGALA